MSWSVPPDCADEDYAEIDGVARKRGRGVLACGNFALTVVLLQRFAEIAARYLDHFEVIDYAHEDKPDAPSGTARELAFRLGQVKAPRSGRAARRRCADRERRAVPR